MIELLGIGRVESVPKTMLVRGAKVSKVRVWFAEFAGAVLRRSRPLVFESSAVGTWERPCLTGRTCWELQRFCIRQDLGPTARLTDNIQLSRLLIR